jgi:hypothetical protein
MGNLTKHAQKELELAGLFDKDSDCLVELASGVLYLKKYGTPA